MSRMMSTEVMNNRLMHGTISDREYRNYRWKVRRQRQIRNRILAVLSTVLLIACLAVSYHSIITHAETETYAEELNFKYYKQIRIEYGDSLWSIAETYADDNYKGVVDYINEVKQINHLEKDTLFEGQDLIIPYYSSEFVY